MSQLIASSLYSNTIRVEGELHLVILSLCCVLQANTTQFSDDLVQDEFEKTSVNMSTYLVAFIVADFTPLSKNVSDTLVRLTDIMILLQTVHAYLSNL